MAIIKTIGVYEETLSGFQIKTASAGRNRKKTLIHSLLAGFYIGLTTYMMFIFGSANYSPILTNLMFGFGFVLVFLAGADLFTNHCMMESEAILAKTTSKKTVTTNLLTILFGNFVGVFLTSLLLQSISNAEINQYILNITTTELSLPISSLIYNGVICGLLFGLIIWLACRCKDNLSKILTILLCSVLFMICGLEHSITNMFQFVSAYLINSNVDLISMGYNLLTVIIANFVGIWLMVLAYHYYNKQ